MLVGGKKSDHIMIHFNSAHKAVLGGLLLGNPNVRPGQMFGYPA